MKHLIVGHGYCGAYLAQSLLDEGQEVIAVSRNPLKPLHSSRIKYLTLDVQAEPLPALCSNACLYYFVAPPSKGKKDTTLQRFLTLNAAKTFKKILYCSSSGVYGNHQGEGVDEDSECTLLFDRQARRLDAEQQWDRYCHHNNIPLIIVRPAGIYGPNRLPLEACQHRKPVIYKNFAPLINHIYVKDLVLAIRLLAEKKTIEGIFNLSDGAPLPMGQLQQRLAELLQLQTAEYVSYDDVWSQSSPMKREFLKSSKRIIIKKILQVLPQFRPTELNTALKEILYQEKML